MSGSADPFLWFDAAHIDHLCRLRDAGEPHLCALLDWAKTESRREGDQLYPQEPHPSGLPHVTGEREYLSACALLALLGSDDDERAGASARAMVVLRHITSGGRPADLGIAAWSMDASILADACWPWLSIADQGFLADLLLELHRRIRSQVSKGNPHIVNNNWWALSHGGCLLTGLALRARRSYADTDLDVDEGVRWSRQRLYAFCHHFGSAGLYHEGLGYQNYTMSMLYPALLADQRHGGRLVAEQFPHLGNTAASMYASVVACRPTADTEEEPSKEQLGMKLSWNDDGPGHIGGSHEMAMLALARSEAMGALRHIYDHLHGIYGDRSFAPAHSGMYFAATLYPYHVPAEDPSSLPTFIADNRQGLVMVRSGWEGSKDCVFGAYARATHVGGHSADDAGSIRLIALGHDWIVGGGQARGAAVYQSVVIDDSGERPKPAPCGSLFWREETAHGGIIAMDLRKFHGAYSERHVAVDYSGACGVPVALALLDQIDDHRSDRGWLWNLSFAPNLSCELDADGHGFRLLAEDGSRLSARFLGDLPQSLEVLEMPASRRTYSAGFTVNYCSRRYIQGRFPAKAPLGILTAITVSPGPGPQLSSAGGTAIRIGDKIWQRPFGDDLPPNFQPGISGGVCPYPNGHR
ncbi:MAG: hypothetical protein EA402_05150 [Planctomycetota bacterium]|nr:MAG: hypothetical protein EA402_05150 [Planctomycetota bacterium]